MEKKIKLSVAIAVYNEEKNLGDCLTSVQAFAEEIIVVDGGSIDGTVAVARRFTKNIITTDNPPIFHINKQKALDACTGEWILQLDADERIRPELRGEILSAIRSQNINGYFIPRNNYFLGRYLQKGGQYPDYVMRLVRRGSAKFPAKSVHEQIEVVGKTAYLTQPMDHISYRTKEEYWEKADTYTTLTALELKKSGIQKSLWNWIVYNVLKPKYTFLNIFIRHKGFVDGWYGYLFALWSALHFPIAYRKFSAL